MKALLPHFQATLICLASSKTSRGAVDTESTPHPVASVRTEILSNILRRKWRRKAGRGKPDY